MIKFKVKTICRITTKTFRPIFIVSSFLIFIWIAYCISLFTAEVLSYNYDEYDDPVIELVKC